MGITSISPAQRPISKATIMLFITMREFYKELVNYLYGKHTKKKLN